MKILVRLFVLALLASAVSPLAQTPEKPAPRFALAIEEKPLEAENTPGTLILLVKYTNVSDVVQKDGCVVTPAAYSILAMHDGLPADKRKPRSEENEESSDPRRIKVNRTEADSCNGITRGIGPKETVKFALWVSSRYDMTVPGIYEITVTRETDQWNPEKSVTVKSNTLTIIVPEPGAAEPQ
jgi:hypothetical protein